MKFFKITKTFEQKCQIYRVKYDFEKTMKSYIIQNKTLIYNFH